MTFYLYYYKARLTDSGDLEEVLVKDDSTFYGNISQCPIIYIQTIDCNGQYRRAELKPMSNPNIYAEDGITPDDINRYEFENAVSNTPKWVMPKVIQRVEFDNGIREIKPREGFKREYLAELEPKQCTCDSIDLFRYGCKCGGV